MGIAYNSPIVWSNNHAMVHLTHSCWYRAGTGFNLAYPVQSLGGICMGSSRQYGLFHNYRTPLTKSVNKSSQISRYQRIPGLLYEWWCICSVTLRIFKILKLSYLFTRPDITCEVFEYQVQPWSVPCWVTVEVHYSLLRPHGWRLYSINLN